MSCMPDQEGISIEMRCPGEMSVLPIIRGFIVNVARQMGFVDDDVDKIEISVDEACANAIEHAYVSDQGSIDKPEHGIHVAMFQGTDRLTIVIRDFGVGAANGPFLGTSNIEDYAKGSVHRGLGSYIMSNLMDEFIIQYPPEKGSKVTLVKNLPRDAAAESPNGY